MTPEQHLWMKERFDRVDTDNKNIKTELTTVHEIVTQHAVYWSIAKYVAGAIVTGSGGILAWFGLSKH